MSPASSPTESRTLVWLGAAFILTFFFFFSYHGLFAYFTFDDGTTIIACLRPFETPFWRDLLNILTVFTSAFRPLTTLFWRPLYEAFGFNPLPFRIVVHILLTLNLGVAYLLARRLQVSREAAAIAVLLFCYNASALDLFYNTCLVGDILCYLFYALAMMAYVKGRQEGQPLGWRAIVATMVPFLLAMDSKEQAVTLPGILVVWEFLYRRNDFRDRAKALRVGGLLAAMFLADAIYLKVKVADMSRNPDYNPHVTVGFILNNIGHYLEQFLYLPEKSVTLLTTVLILGVLLALGALLRSVPAVFGVVFYVASLIPVAVIQPRAGYAAYIPLFGLALAVGAILADGRAYLVNLTGRSKLQSPTAIGAFLCVALLIGWAHMVNRMPGTGYYEWSNPGIIKLMENFRTNIPEFPPNARVLLTDDPWGPDYGPMFLVRLLYHDNSIWVDRPKNMTQPPDLTSYDMVISYRQPDVDLSPAKFLKIPMKWETRGKALGNGQFLMSSPNAHGAASIVDFAPRRVKSGEKTTMKVPGLSNVAVNVVYRTISGKNSTAHVLEDWCTLDEKGTCEVIAPFGVKRGEMMVDWIQPAGQRWIFTSGLLAIVE